MSVIFMVFCLGQSNQNNRILNTKDTDFLGRQSRLQVQFHQQMKKMPFSEIFQKAIEVTYVRSNLHPFFPLVPPFPPIILALRCYIRTVL